MIYLELFWAFFKVGLFSIGGGYAALPLIQDVVVASNKWMSMAEFTDIITISQMTPGPISINSATFVGMRIGGFFGAVIATLGCIFPSFIIVIILSILYNKYKSLRYVQGILDGLRPSTVGLIASAGFAIITLTLWSEVEIVYDISKIDLLSLVFILSCVIILRKTKMSPTLILLGVGMIIGLFYNFIG